MAIVHGNVQDHKVPVVFQLGTFNFVDDVVLSLHIMIREAVLLLAFYLLQQHIGPPLFKPESVIIYPDFLHGEKRFLPKIRNQTQIP